MKPRVLQPGDGIGIASPSWLATPEDYEPVFRAIEELGYRPVPGKNLYARGWGYAASDRERAEDINCLIRDERVNMIFFGGGEGGDEVIPLIDYEAAKRSPKIYLSYSDGTSILNAIHTRTGIITFYGQNPHDFLDESPYIHDQFRRHILGEAPSCHVKNHPWKTLVPGKANGLLTGGYLDNYVFLACCGWIKPEPEKKYMLFLEESERFFGIEHVSDAIGRLEQSPIMPCVAGLLFGHYSEEPCPQLWERLTRFGEKHGIPVAYCDDFGHGDDHAVLPIGAEASFDADAHTLSYRYGE